MNLRADQYVPPSRAQLDARLRQADKPGEHLWVMTAGWTITDPASAYRGDVKLMDRNNLVVFAGPGCYKCGREYSSKMAKRPCLGVL